MEEVDQGVAPHGVVGRLLLTAAIVEVLIGALPEAFPHRRRPRVVVVGEGVAWPVVPMPRRCVRHRQAARVGLQLGCLVCSTRNRWMGQGVAWVMAQQAEEEGGRGSGSIRRRG